MEDLCADLENQLWIVPSVQMLLWRLWCSKARSLNPGVSYSDGNNLRLRGREKQLDSHTQLITISFREGGGVSSTRRTKMSGISMKSCYTSHCRSSLSIPGQLSLSRSSSWTTVAVVHLRHSESCEYSSYNSACEMQKFRSFLWASQVSLHQDRDILR